eukprot:TRINITY_DN914_c0_g3_i1.p1 TRINITY_DN914_c0_g3~~TRINITY_DN914_c0_g3_i1.p1  ORF type:complete len:685 (+),score=202.64 TRINITY_DN914_c0_g3_i1:188-2056(+)
MSDLYQGYSDTTELQRVGESLQNVKQAFSDDDNDVVVVKRKGMEDEKEEREVTLLELIREEKAKSTHMKHVDRRSTGDQLSFMDFLREEPVSTTTNRKLDNATRQEFKSVPALSSKEPEDKVSFLEFLKLEEVPKKESATKREPSTEKMSFLEFLREEPAQEEKKKKSGTSPSVSPPTRAKQPATERVATRTRNNEEKVDSTKDKRASVGTKNTEEKLSFTDFLKEEPTQKEKEEPKLVATKEEPKLVAVQRWNTTPVKVDTDKAEPTKDKGSSVGTKNTEEKLSFTDFLKDEPPQKEKEKEKEKEEEDKISFYEFLREAPPPEKRSKGKKHKSKEKPELKKSMTSTEDSLKEKYGNPTKAPSVPKLVTTKVDTKPSTSQVKSPKSPKSPKTDRAGEAAEMDFYEFLRNEKNRKKAEPQVPEKATRSKKLKGKETSKKHIDKSPPEKSNSLDKGVGNQLFTLGKFLLDEPRKTKTRKTLPKRKSEEAIEKQKNFEEFYETNKDQTHETPEEDMEEDTQDWISFLRSTKTTTPNTNGVKIPATVEEAKENSTSRSETSIISFLLDFEEGDNSSNKDSVMKLLEMEKSVEQSTEIFQFLQTTVEQPDAAEVVRTLSRILPTFDV